MFEPGAFGNPAPISDFVLREKRRRFRFGRLFSGPGGGGERKGCAVPLRFVQPTGVVNRRTIPKAAATVSPLAPRAKRTFSAARRSLHAGWKLPVRRCSLSMLSIVHANWSVPLSNLSEGARKRLRANRARGAKWLSLDTWGGNCLCFRKHARQAPLVLPEMRHSSYGGVERPGSSHLARWLT